MRYSEILREMTYALNCAKCFFCEQNFTQRKQNVAFRSAKIAQKFCERKPYLHDYLLWWSLEICTAVWRFEQLFGDLHKETGGLETSFSRSFTVYSSCLSIYLSISPIYLYIYPGYICISLSIPAIYISIWALYLSIHPGYIYLYLSIYIYINVSIYFGYIYVYKYISRLSCPSIYLYIFSICLISIHPIHLLSI